MKRCELCPATAAMYCDSDSASLCWDCDAKVHSANFLVERHQRSLLCHVCQSPTTWTASGSKLGRTISVCERCVRSKDRDYRAIVAEAVDDEDFEYDEDDSDNEDNEMSDSDEDDDEEDNQVVPWTCPPPPPSSSSGDESSSRNLGLSIKRSRDTVSDCCSDDEFDCSSSPWNTYSFSARESRPDCVDLLNSIKRIRTQPDPVCTVQCGPANSIVDSVDRLSGHDITSADDNAKAVIAGICEVSRNAPAVGCSTANSP